MAAGLGWVMRISGLHLATYRKRYLPPCPNNKAKTGGIKNSIASSGFIPTELDGYYHISISQ